MIAASEVLERIRASGAMTTAAVREVRRAVSREIAEESRGDVMRLAFHLVAAGGNGRWVAYELVQHHRGASGGITPREVERLGQGIDSWGAVDAFGCFISGPAWRAERITDAVVERWARSRDRWWRRAALVSTVPLNLRSSGGKGDIARTLKVCQTLIDDRDDMVVKALSWALRELAKHEPAAVLSFVEFNRAGLAARVLREVRNKLTTGLKNP